MFAGPPNGGKSLLALWYVVKSNLPTLYISADTDQTTTLLRSLAMLTGDKVDDIETAIEEGAQEAYIGELQNIDNVRFSFDPTPTLDDINLEVLAFEEMWGDPPQILIVDNLLNVINANGGTSKESMNEVSQFLHHVARMSEAAVILLHHTSESVGRPTLPAPRHAVQQKVNELPELILTTALDPVENKLMVAPVKNRSGFHDASGHTYSTLYVVAERMTIFEDHQSMVLAQQRWSYV